MNTRNKISRAIILGIVVILILFVEYKYWTIESKEPIAKEIASGIVTDKSIVSYSCGKHGNSTCYDHYLTINDKKYNTNASDFTRTAIGSNTTLTITERYYPSGWEIFFLIIHTTLSLIVGAIILINVWMFAYWSTSVDDETLLEFMKRQWGV